MKDNLHYILEEDGRSLTVVNGVVTSVSNPTPLSNTPDDWRNIIVNWERIMKQFGVQRSFATPLGYVRDAAMIVRKAIYGQSYERKLYHLIQQLNTEVTDTTYRQRYKYVYKGELDLSTFDDQETQVKVGIMEGGISKLLKANEATVYEIPLDDDAINIAMDGVFLQMKQNWIVQAGTEGEGGVILGTIKTSNEGSAAGFVAFDVFLTDQTIDFTTDPNYFFITPLAINSLRLFGSLKFALAGLIDPDAEVILKTSLGNNVSLGSVSGLNTTHTVDFNVTINTVAGEKFFLCIDKGDSLITVLETNISAKFQSRKPTTYVKAFKPYDLYRKLIKKITGRDIDAASVLLQDESNLVITCGDALRGIEGAKIKTSLNQFFEHAAVAHFAGMGIERNQVVIENRQHFFDSSDPIHLGNAKDLKINLAKDIMGNKVKIGWTDPDVEELNGKFAFNGSHQYTSNITRVTTELTYVSPYSADPYEIENIRANFDGKTTTDDSSDNKNYVINVDIENPVEVDDIGTVYPLTRVTYDNEGDAEDFGLPTNTVFNIEELTPKRLLKKHGSWLRSLLHPFDLEKLTFQSTQRNSNLKTVLGSEITQENAQQPIHLLGDRIFLPFYFEFDTEVPASLITLLEENPNRCFSFDWNGDTYKGFTIKVSQAINTEADQRIKLLCAPDVDITKLIY